MESTAPAMADIIKVGNELYVRARSSLADSETRALMHGDLFAVFDRHGDFQSVGFGKHGLFYRDTRHLSSLLLCLAEERLLFLGSAVREDNAVLAVDLTNPHLELPNGGRLPYGSVHIYRTKFLNRNTCYERMRVRNYGLGPASFELLIQFAADFADIFEIRGYRRSNRGTFLPPEVHKRSVTFAYQGLDGIIRTTTLSSTLEPAGITDSEMRFRLDLQPGVEKELVIQVSCDAGGKLPVLSYAEAAIARDHRESEIDSVEIHTSNEQFNEWLNRSRADLRTTITETSEGPYPYAGVPWFGTPFGRDGLITALECLWLDPALSKGVLRYLALTQATEDNPVQDAEPGKILHETRKSELSQIGEVPFGRYYGSADSTPLFLYLAAAYFERTADLEFLKTIWPNIELALQWIEKFGDRDGDGFVEYGRRSGKGLVHQGWKDSQDSVFHADGSLAEPPIAVCELQAYVYAAKIGISEVAAALGYPEEARKLVEEAKALRERFQDAFWSEELGLYVLALDKDKNQCRVASSNAGHCLYTGIATKERVRKIMERFRDKAFFSGFGIRTIPSTEKRYNPMAYHNGSVWPHDNALIAFGCTKSEYKDLACEILNGLLDASIFLDFHRLPELFCGFPRRKGRGPTLYTVACPLQAWAAGTVFLVLQACLGLGIRGGESRVYFYYPTLPKSIQQVRIRNLRVGNGSVDLELRRREGAVSVTILRREGDLEIVTIK